MLFMRTELPHMSARNARNPQNMIHRKRMNIIALAIIMIVTFS